MHANFLGRKFVNLWRLIFTEFEGPRGHVTGILEAANYHKVDRFIPVYLGEYRY